ncbi:SRPBCC family protein, partial [Geodermatophilus marinus]|uniref:SRPBCC family protein n=1 Tax=Geodermatophilus sp. LHW52908 TaxID=2303986 RepID=UPI0018F69165
MGVELRTSVDIRSTPDRVWRVLTDLAAYPAWNPFIVAAHGEVVVGGRLSLTMQPVGARRVTVRPTVVEVSPCRLTPDRLVFGVSLGGLADVVAGGAVSVLRPGRAPRAGTGG